MEIHYFTVLYPDVPDRKNKISKQSNACLGYETHSGRKDLKIILLTTGRHAKSYYTFLSQKLLIKNDNYLIKEKGFTLNEFW